MNAWIIVYFAVGLLFSLMVTGYNIRNKEKPYQMFVEFLLVFLFWVILLPMGVGYRLADNKLVEKDK